MNHLLLTRFESNAVLDFHEYKLLMIVISSLKLSVVIIWIDNDVSLKVII